MTTAPAPAALRPLRPDPAPVRTRPKTAAAPPADRPDHITRAAGPRLRLLRHEPDPDGAPADVAPTPVPGPVPTIPDDLRETPDLRRRAHQVLCLVLEVLDGRRPPAHLVAHLEPPALRYVRAAMGPSAARRPSRLTALRVQRPCTGAIEVAAVHDVGGRARALAARFEGRPDEPGRWRCVAVRLL